MRRRAFWIGLLLSVFALSIPVGGQPFSAQIQLAINQLATGITTFTRVRLNVSRYINWGAGTDDAGYGFRDNAGNIQVKNSGGAWTTITGAGGNPIDSSYWTRVPEGALTNETPLSALATALILNTTATGVPVAYAGTSCTNQFPRSLSVVGAATCATVDLLLDTTATLTVARGGTGLTTGTSGGVLAFTGATTLASSVALTANAIVLGGGAGATPSPLASLGTTTTLLHGNAAGAPTFGAVVLTTDVSGILAGANGGTANGFFAVAGPAASLKTFTFPNVSTTILTTNAAVTAIQGGTGHVVFAVGDLLQADTTTTLARLAATSTGNALISGGVGVISSWGKIGLATHISGTLAAANGGTGLTAYTTGDLIVASSATTLTQRLAVALGQTLISQGVATAPIWSTALRISTINLGPNLSFSNAAPTISAGFGTTPSVTAGTTAAFRLDVGTGGAASSGTIGLPTAMTGWNCEVENLTGTLANRADQRTLQISSTTTTAVVENQTISTGAVLVWTASDILAVSCTAF